MAEEAATNGSPLESTEPLDTVDLKSPSAGRPVLEFESQAGSNSDTLPPPPAPGAVNPESPIEGTELQSRPRSKSAGLSFKEWSSHQIKVSKQLFSERFGHGVRTVDAQLETRIETLKDTQKKYAQLIALSVQFGNHLSQVLETQKTLAEHFAFMSVRAPELHTEFRCNSESQKVFAKNGQALLAAVRAFVSGMQTICSKTMEDTLQTVKEYDSVRLTYDAYRNELETLKKQANTSQKAADRVAGATAEFEKKKTKFEQLRNDVDIKLKLLDENKLKVTRQNLVLLHGAFAAYYSGNHTAMQEHIRELNSLLESGHQGNDPPQWLEDLPGREGSP